MDKEHKTIIYETVNYKQFKHYESNRLKSEAHIAYLMEDPTFAKNFIKFPMRVNKDLFVIDGQHRLEAAQRLGVPVFYRIDTEATEEDMVLCNERQKNWVLRDFIHFNSYKSPTYFFLKDVLEKFKMITPSAIIAIICHISDIKVHNIHAKIKKGQLNITKEQMDEVLGFLQEFEPFLREVKRTRGKEAAPYGYNAYLAGFCLLYKNDRKLFYKAMEKAMITNIKPPYLTVSEDAFKYLIKIANWKVPRTFMQPTFDFEQEEAVNE